MTILEKPQPGGAGGPCLATTSHAATHMFTAAFCGSVSEIQLHSVLWLWGSAFATGQKQEGFVWTKGSSFVCSSSEPVVINTAIIWVLYWQFGERRRERETRGAVLISQVKKQNKPKQTNKRLWLGILTPKAVSKSVASLFLPAKSPLYLLDLFLLEAGGRAVLKSARGRAWQARHMIVWPQEN